MKFNMVDAVASFPTATRKSFRATRESYISCMRKTREHLLQTIRDLPHVSRLRLRQVVRYSLVPVNHRER